MSAYPVRNPVKWRMEGGRAIIIYKKDLGRVEKKIQKVIGGPENIRRPLDDKGTDIWQMCDGEHTLLQICEEMDKKYKEEMEPVIKRVGRFIEMLLSLNLISLKTPEEMNGEEE
jgi:hypothetical protein